jgi:hypothetical protein
MDYNDDAIEAQSLKPDAWNWKPEVLRDLMIAGIRKVESDKALSKAPQRHPRT